MKAISIILISFGVLLMVCLGVYWIVDYGKSIEQIIAVEEFVGNTNALDQELIHLKTLRDAAYLMIGIALLCVLALIYMNYLRIVAIALFVGSPLIVAIMSIPETLVFTSPLLIGGIIAYLSIRKQKPLAYIRVE